MSSIFLGFFKIPFYPTVFFCSLSLMKSRFSAGHCQTPANPETIVSKRKARIKKETPAYAILLLFACFMASFRLNKGNGTQKNLLHLFILMIIKQGILKKERFIDDILSSYTNRVIFNTLFAQASPHLLSTKETSFALHNKHGMRTRKKGNFMAKSSAFVPAFWFVCF